MQASRWLYGIAVVMGMVLPGAARAQDVLARTPNLSGGWVGTTSAARFHFNHRFWTVPTSAGDKVLNSPTFLLGFPLPGNLLVAARYASNSGLGDEVNEWEAFARWAPPTFPGPVQIAVTGGYNGGAGSGDAELSLRLPIRLPEDLPIDSLQLLGAARGFSDAQGSGEAGWFAGGGVLIHLGPNLALAGDFGQMESDGVDAREVWGAGVQLRIPATPHTVSFQATNAPTGTLQGSSTGRRTTWGFEFTIPLTYARFFP